MRKTKYKHKWRLLKTEVSPDRTVWIHTFYCEYCLKFKEKIE